MRLDGVCAKALGWSRKEAREQILSGKVTINKETVTDPGRKVSPDDRIFWGTEAVDQAEHVYLMLNKPLGTVCTTDDLPESVMKLLEPRYVKRGVFPVGRLDKDTGGLVLLTDDGAFSHRLMSPRRHVEKEYEVTLARPLAPEDVAALEAGLRLENGEETRPCRIADADGCFCRIFLREGKYHQVKRMFAARGNRVTALFRPALGPLRLDPVLAPGQSRPLTPEERKLFDE